MPVRVASCLLLLVALLPARAQDATPSPSPGETPRPEMPGPPPDMGDRAVRFLVEELQLDAKQEAEVSKILNEAIRDAMRQMAERWNPDQGAPDMNAMRGQMESMRVDVARKIRALLTPAQEREFDALVDQFDRRSQRWEQQARAWQDPTQLYEPPPISRAILLDKAERALFLGPEETAAVMPAVAKVIDRRIAWAEARRVHRGDLKNALDGGARREEVRSRLDELRAREDFLRLELAAAEQELRELLTLEQEIRFVAMGVLD